MRYKCVLYDFDGTIGDSVPCIIKSQQMAYEKVLGKCDRSFENLLSYVGRPLIDTFSMHDGETCKKLMDTYSEINLGFLKRGDVGFFPGVREELLKLKEMGVKQGIVSSKRRSSLMLTLDNLGFSDFFDILLTKEDTVLHKPDPAPLILACETLGVEISDMIYVGDARVDIECARNAGADQVFVEWSIMPREDILKLKPTYVISEMKELSCIISDGEL